MNLFLLLSAIVILACVLCNRLSSKLGVPTLLAFILLGMFFGCDGVVKIPFENYTLAQNICSVALIFIMFYGGFGTNWAQARPVAVKATVLSSLGTLGTAGLVGLFCWKVLGLEMLLGFLLGAVIASTDAASVFSILRSKHLDLKEGTASPGSGERQQRPLFLHAHRDPSLADERFRLRPGLCLSGLRAVGLWRCLGCPHRLGRPEIFTVLPVLHGWL